MKMNNFAGISFNKTTKTNNTVVWEHLHNVSYLVLIVIMSYF